jgi:hypothetical protein
MPTLSPKTFGLDHGHPLNANFVERLFHVIQLEGLNNGFDFFHGFAFSLNGLIGGGDKLPSRLRLVPSAAKVWPPPNLPKPCSHLHKNYANVGSKNVTPTSLFKLSFLAKQTPVKGGFAHDAACPVYRPSPAKPADPPVQGMAPHEKAAGR